MKDSLRNIILSRYTHTYTTWRHQCTFLVSSTSSTNLIPSAPFKHRHSGLRIPTRTWLFNSTIYFDIAFFHWPRLVHSSIFQSPNVLSHVSVLFNPNTHPFLLYLYLASFIVALEPAATPDGYFIWVSAVFCALWACTSHYILSISSRVISERNMFYQLHIHLLSLLVELFLPLFFDYLLYFCSSRFCAFKRLAFLLLYLFLWWLSFSFFFFLPYFIPTS